MLQVEPFCALFPATSVLSCCWPRMYDQSRRLGSSPATNNQAGPPEPESLFSHNPESSGAFPVETGDFPYLCANERPNPVRAADSTSASIPSHWNPDAS